MMNIHVQLKMNEALFLRDPESTELGQKIIKQGIRLIYELGYDSFTFKKLAEAIGTTEAGVYRYFENKHALLVYLNSWYWGWLEFQVRYHTNNLKDPVAQLERVIKLLVSPLKGDLQSSYATEQLHQLVLSEGAKVYRSDRDKQNPGIPYTSLCTLIAQVISTCNPNYPFAKSLALTLIEMAHFQNFYMSDSPSPADFQAGKGKEEVIAFLNDLVFMRLKMG